MECRVKQQSDEVFNEKRISIIYKRYERLLMTNWSCFGLMREINALELVFSFSKYIVIKLFRDFMVREDIPLKGKVVRLGDRLIAVEAAHIKWYQAGGPDQEDNGIALCSMHHKLFDRGAFTLNTSLELQIAQVAYGTSGFDEWLMRFHGKALRQPHSPYYRPAHPFIKWHNREVFSGPARVCNC